MAFARRFSLSDAVPGEEIKSLNVGEGYDRDEVSSAVPRKAPIFKGDYIEEQQTPEMRVRFSSLTTASELSITDKLEGEVPAVAEAIKLGFKSAYERTARHTSDSFCCALVKAVFTSRKSIKAAAEFDPAAVKMLKDKPVQFKSHYGTHYLAEQDMGAALIIYINAKTAKDVVTNKLSSELNASVPGTDFTAALKALHEKVKSNEIMQIECRLTVKGVTFPTGDLVFSITKADGEAKWAKLQDFVNKTVASFDKTVEKAKGKSYAFHTFEGRFRDYWNIAVAANPENAAVHDQVTQHILGSREIENLINRLAHAFEGCPDASDQIENLNIAHNNLRKARHSLETAWAGDPAKILATYETNVAKILAGLDTLLAELLRLKLIHAAFPVVISTKIKDHIYNISHSYRTGAKYSTFVGYHRDRPPISNIYLVPAERGQYFVGDGKQVYLRIADKRGEYAIMPTLTVDFDKPLWPTVEAIDKEGASWTIQYQDDARRTSALADNDTVILVHPATNKQLGDSKRDGEVQVSGEYTVGCQAVAKSTEREGMVYRVGLHPANNFNRALVYPVVSSLAKAMNSFSQTLTKGIASITPVTDGVLATYRSPAHRVVQGAFAGSGGAASGSSRPAAAPVAE